MSFVDNLNKRSGKYALQIKQGNEHIIYLVTGNHGEYLCWNYVMVSKKEAHNFLLALQRNSIKLSEYGKILHSGLGEKPPEEIKKQVHDDYL